MGIYCVLCGNRNKTVSYHRFPKDEHIREKWLSFCGIEEKTINTATTLCSNHFKEEDLNKRINCAVVNPGAIPSINTRKRKKNLNTIKDECQLLMKKHNLNEIVSVVEVDTSDNSQTAVNTVSTLIEVSCRTSPRTPPRTSPRTPPRTTSVSEPRDVDDIRTPHLATPQRAKRALALARRVINQQTRTIKSLQQSRNRLNARIKNIKDLIIELNRKNLISESALDNIMVSLFTD